MPVAARVGAGYSSWVYLKRFPVDALKIDLSFVDGVASFEDYTIITRVIVALGKNLNLNVIAEGLKPRRNSHA
jgi:sensor c-di-GMP phosphodiesterase-like protein